MQETFLKERWRQKFYGKEMGVTALHEVEGFLRHCCVFHLYAS